MTERVLKGAVFPDTVNDVSRIILGTTSRSDTGKARLSPSQSQNPGITVSDEEAQRQKQGASRAAL